MNEAVKEVGPMVRVLETAEFHEAVHALTPEIAVFDCDGTLWSGDAGTGFMAWTIEHGVISKEATDWLLGRYEEYKAGTVSEVEICGEMVQVYRGLTEAQVRGAAAEFFAAKIEKNIFPEMLELVTALQAKGVDIWAVSSTNDWVVEEGVKRFGIPSNRVLSARVRIANGVVTDEILDVPTDEGKVASLKDAGILAPDAVFGNSVHDAAMLAIARGAFPVNPTAALVERSVAEGWALYYPASVVPLVG
ncbi:HAD family hydrolase [Granulicella sibirica]|uniref:Phosphoserine phosphatase n=1 Tax=Granulicella sibirica TaxID=2479048 RepID=A0A4Q0SZY9_9BACT|nr:haloacid dehalogenase-like hydrolase [Granulicella sibirica]RXH56903.1 Phosphoserine phosphatase [Granulicella sibirica]